MENLEKSTNSPTKQSKKPSPKDLGDRVPDKWTNDEKINLQKKYSCEILLENGTPEKLKNKNQPSDAVIVTYEFGGTTCRDLIRGKRVDIFDLYYDYFGPGVLKSIDFGEGTISPTLWKYSQKPQTKKKK
jgi:hypothetical protein|tara:strand:- start:281 stop:670 length:390 start_codon:yes stop_codon:yes gene_type:complete